MCSPAMGVAPRLTGKCGGLFAELQEASQDTQSRFKAEKQSRKQLDMKIAALEEELTDLRVEKETLERVCPVPQQSFSCLLKINPRFFLLNNLSLVNLDSSAG